MPRRLITAIIFALFFSLYMGGCAQVELEIGDYIQFGRYNDVPIIWRVINRN